MEQDQEVGLLSDGSAGRRENHINAHESDSQDDNELFVKNGEMKLEETLEKIGFGRYQIQQYLLLCLAGFTSSMHMLSSGFLCATPNFKCAVSLSDGIEQVDNGTVWRRTSEECEVYNQSAGNVSFPCTTFIFDTSTYESSIVSDWNLVCGLHWLKALAESAFMAGVLVGAVVFGSLSDKYGRKVVVSLSNSLAVVFGILSALMPELATFTAIRFVEGTLVSGSYLPAYCLANELIRSERRTIAATIFHLPGMFGGLLLALIAYRLRRWRYVEIALTLPGTVTFIYWWWLDESIRWLLAEGKVMKAERLVRKAAATNKVRLPINFSLQPPTSNTAAGTATLLDLLRSSRPNLRKKTSVIFFLWFVNSLVFYGIQLNMEGLPGNDYVLFTLSMLVEIPGTFIILFFLDRIGRRLLQSYTLMVAGFCCFATGLVPKDYAAVIVILAMIGKLAIGSSFGVVYQYSAEIFPTVTRNAGIGASSMCARVGGIMAPILILLDDVISRSQFIILGIFGLIASVLACLLPETKGTSLPETLEDGEAFGKRICVNVKAAYKNNSSAASTLVLVDDSNSEFEEDGGDQVVFTKS